MGRFAIVFSQLLQLCSQCMLCKAFFFQLLGRCQAVARCRRNLRFKNKLLSLDASVIDLCASLFDRAKFRRRKGTVKLHLLLDHDGYLPCFAVTAKVSGIS